MLLIYKVNVLFIQIKFPVINLAISFISGCLNIILLKKQQQQEAHMGLYHSPGNVDLLYISICKLNFL